MPSVALVVLIAALTALAGSRIQLGATMTPATLPWDLADAARRQITIVTGQAAVAVTSLVLLVTLVRGQTGVASESFNTVVVMILIAFFSFIGIAVQFANLPIEGGTEGTTVPRWLYVIATTQSYRTLFLSWLALKPLVDTFGLHEPAAVLSWVLGTTALAGWLLAASGIYRIGILRGNVVFVAPVIGIGAALALRLILGQSAFGLGISADDVLGLTLLLFALNVVGFTINGFAPISWASTRGAGLIERWASLYTLVDFQASVTALALIWLALV
jgi:hypothetical protein